MQQEKLIADYWIEKFKSFDTKRFPFDLESRPSGVERIKGNKTHAEEINKLTQGNALAAYTIYLAMFSALLKKHTDGDSIWIASSNMLLEPESPFKDTLLFYKFDLIKNQTLKEIINSVKSEIQSTLPYNEIDFSVLRKQIAHINENELFQFGFSYSPINLPNELLSKTALSFNLKEESDGAIELNIQYDKKKYNADYIKNLAQHYLFLIENISSLLSQALSDISLVTKQERKFLLDFAGTFKNTDTQSVIACFEQRVLETPDKTALVFRDKKLSYAQLNNKANQLAVLLQNNYSVSAGDKIGVCTDYSDHTLIAFLAILKTGAVYVPLDPSLPVERLQFIMNDTVPKALVIHSDYFENTILYNIPTFNIDIELDDQEEEIPNLTIVPHPDSVVYIMYTSGSTGKPKGVLINNKGVMRLVRNTNYIELVPDDTILGISSTAFDGSTFDIWGAFLNGGTLVIPQKNVLLDFKLLAETIEKNSVSVIFITTALFNSIVDNSIESFSGLSKILFGGEMVSLKHVRAFIDRYGDDKLLHVYGPTENTSFSTFFPVTKNALTHTVPIGKAITSTQCYILDEKLNLQPIGVPGHLYVGGEGLANGYLNDQELSSKKFVQNPYQENTLIYDTGDLCRWLPDGNIEILGRIDNQLKIRGFRVELGEIEMHITSYPGIKEALVITRTDKDNIKELAAYFIAEKDIEGNELKKQLQKNLPEYMIPAHIMQLARFPLTVNGKIDKALLPSPESGILNAGTDYIPPQVEIEEQLAAIWAEVLGINKSVIGIDHNFFELGGNSIRIIKLAKQVSKLFSREVGISVLFEYTTIRTLSEFLNKVEKIADTTLQEEEDLIEEYESRSGGNDIAIVGISGQFPDSNNHIEFWEKISGGKELLRTFTPEESILNGADPGSVASGKFVRTIGLVNNKEFFDHGFFEFTPEEAALMDPQIRLFYQHCWSALEDAGQTSMISKKKIGLFAGASENKNWQIYVHGKMATEELNSFYIDKLSNSSFMNTLVSYKLNLRGPSMYINTACSTSLVAVDLACENLLRNRCSIALAGGVNISTVKEKGYYYEEGMISSEDGHCRAFDASSTGTAHGEGVGVVVLKRLGDALKDGDNIYAVIKSTAVNNDGNLKVGYTAPSVKGQADCIRVAHKMAGIDPRTISYVETHGTGTKLGDPIEIRALNEAFATGGADKYCAIGSVKTNAGHLDIAAGIAGLIKTTLSLRNKKIPASLNFKFPNPEIDFADGPFYVNTELKNWERKNDLPLRAGVSSFGIGGTNAHVILEEAPFVGSTAPEKKYNLVTISAKTEKSLKRYQQDLLDFLIVEPHTSLSNLCYTLQTGRKHFTYRKSISFQTMDELQEQLSETKSGDNIIKSRENNCSLVFMFPGQGSQYVNMGKNIYEGESLFRDEMDKGFAFLKELSGIDHKEIVFDVKPSDLRINETQFTQPLLFLFEYSLAKLLMARGLMPESMIGHSIGEYVAACISGVMSYEDALRIVVKRGQLMSKVTAGKMISVSMTESESMAYLKNDLSVAAVNGPEQIVFSGTDTAVNLLIKELELKQIPFVKLHTSHAFHSAMLDSVLPEFEEELRKIQLKEPKIPFISNLTGKKIKAEEAMSLTYWSKHMRETVKFSEGIQTLMNQKAERQYFEVGAGNSLTTFLRQHQKNGLMPLCTNLVRHPKEVVDDMIYFSERIGKMWAQGVAIDWDLFYNKEGRRKISLPTYSFEKIKYPVEVDPFEDGGMFGNSRRLVSNAELKDWIYYPVWRSTILEKNVPVANSKGIILFSTGDTFTNLVIENLRKKGNVTVEVLIGKEYKKESANCYLIDPASPEDYRMVFADLKNENIEITDIIHAWSIGVDPSEIRWTASNEALSRIYFSLVFIAKGLLHIDALSNKRVSVITDALYNVVGNEQPTYASSLLLGVLNVLSQEYGIASLNIDVNLAELRLENAAIKVVDEIVYNVSDRFVSIRNGKRWLRDYQKHGTVLQKETNRIHQGGIIMVTGGLGNVGTVLSDFLMKEYSCRIAIMGRREIDEALTQKLNALNKNGSEIAYYKGDVSDRESLKKVVEEIEKNQGLISGIIHAAGVTNMDHFELIEDISIEKALEIFAPKAQGIENIYEVFKDKKPDFVWVTSSLASVLGGLSFATYASANLFMDHFISSKSSELTGWKCLNLSEMIFSKEDLEAENMTQRRAVNPLELSQLFDWSVALNDQSQLLITVRDLFARLDDVYGKKKESYMNSDFDQVVEKQERPNLSTAYAVPETETEKILVSMIESFFGIDQIGIDDNFFELGGDSLKAMVLLKRLKKDLNVNLSLKEFFAKQNIRQVAADIDEILWIAADVEMDNEMTI
jgi:amino acid adenylation domain-containing protein